MATAPPTVTFTSVAEVCTHLRNGARRLLRKVPELELAAQNGHCAMFASMIKDKELGGDAYLIRTCGQALVGLPELEMTVPSVYMNAANQIFADLMAYALDELAAGRTRAELDKFRVGRQVAAARFGFAYVVESCPEGEWPPIWRKFRKARGAPFEALKLSFMGVHHVAHCCGYCQAPLDMRTAPTTCDYCKRMYYCSPACKRMDVQHENLCQQGYLQARGYQPSSRGGDGRIGASGDARVCSACKSTLSSSSFSAKQYKAKASKRRCMACISSMQ